MLLLLVQCHSAENGTRIIELTLLHYFSTFQSHLKFSANDKFLHYLKKKKIITLQYYLCYVQKIMILDLASYIRIDPGWHLYQTLLAHLPTISNGKQQIYPMFCV